MTKPFSMFEFPNVPTAHKIMLIGEAPGADEEVMQKPFVGSSGKLLNDLLQIAGFRRGYFEKKYENEFYLTNVFTQRPPDNEFDKHWTVTKTELKKLGGGTLPPIGKRWLLPNLEPEVARLREEIAEIKPDLIIALGGKALWSLTGDARITMFRGTFFDTDFGCPAIATFHPAMVLRQWEMRPIVWADLGKAKRFLNGSLPAPLDRKLWINPTFEEMELVYNSFLASGELLGVDIETDPRIDLITTISFSTPHEGICIPVYDKHTLPDRVNYWPTIEEEYKAWEWIRKFCELPNPKVGQNFLYDMQYLLDPLDIRPRNVLHDTSILQHSMQPELKKDLGTLNSLYLNEPSWKFLLHSSKDDNKADD